MHICMCVCMTHIYMCSIYICVNICILYTYIHEEVRYACVCVQRFLYLL